MTTLDFSLWLMIGLFSVQCVQAADEDCKNASTTAAMRACENSRYAKSETELQAASVQLMKQLDSGQQQKFRSAQRAWTAFRDANAEFLSGMGGGGTLTPLIKVSALADMTEARIKELQKLQKQP